MFALFAEDIFFIRLLQFFSFLASPTRCEITPKFQGWKKPNLFWTKILFFGFLCFSGFFILKQNFDPFDFFV